MMRLQVPHAELMAAVSVALLWCRRAQAQAATMSPASLLTSHEHFLKEEMESAQAWDRESLTPLLRSPRRGLVRHSDQSCCWALSSDSSGTSVYLHSQRPH